MAEKIRALLATSRTANLPSVVSNVWLGILIPFLSESTYHAVQLPRAAMAVGAGVLLYVGGNFLNDWYDRGWDQKHRPERALPGGLFKPGLFAVIAGLTGAGGLILGWLAGGGMFVTILVALIVLYTVFHKRTRWAVLIMGLCRAMLVPLGASCISGPPHHAGIALAMAGITAYIAGISLSARYESMPEPPSGALVCARGLLVVAGLFFATVAGFSFSLLPFAIWLALAMTVFRRPLSRQVSALLAGIPLLDWIITLPIALTFPVWPIDCWTATMWIAPLAFISAILLQRLAPAT